VAFTGWNDACEAASGAVAHLLEYHGVTEPFAVVEPEEFFDFQEHRPVVSVGDGGTRRLSWPETRFYAVLRPQADRDLVVVLGEEPSFRWKTFSRTVARVLHEADVEEVVLLGAYIGPVTHRQPVPLSGVATEPSLVTAAGLDTVAYEGPTGIVGVLLEACREVGLPALSVWAATPHYLAASENPAAALALLRKTADVLGLRLDDSSLARTATEFRARVDEAVGSSGQLADYIAEIGEEESGDGIDPDLTRELVTEIERFLRDQR